MKQLLITIILSFFLYSCSLPTPHVPSQNERAVIDTLMNEFNCKIGTSFGSDGDSYFKLTVKNPNVSSDSIVPLVNYIAQKYLPHLDYKDKLEKLVIEVESGSDGPVRA